METKHTKGEWISECEELQIIVYSDIFGGICTIPHLGKHVEEHEANAKLIAAAPDLLEALIFCKKALEVVSSWGATTPIIERAEKAIKKATL